MENKKLIEKLTAYNITQDHQVIAKCLAGLCVDMYRFYVFAELPKNEQESLKRRCKMHYDSLMEFIKNDSNEDIKIIVMNSEKGV